METLIKFFNYPFLVFFLLTAGTDISITQVQNKSGNIVENVSHSVSNEDIIITYDLNGTTEQFYEVKLILRRSNHSNFRYVPQALTGDVGEGYFAGTGKKIIWKIEKDFPSGLPGDDYYFEVMVKEISSSSNIFTWVGAGIAAAAAAVITYIVINSSSSSDEGNGGSSGLPPPPGRP
jgi:hypothetical protein